MKITQTNPCAVPTRRYGSFAGKTQTESELLFASTSRRRTVDDEEADSPSRRRIGNAAGMLVVEQATRGTPPRSRGRAVAMELEDLLETRRIRSETGPRRTKYYHDGRGEYRVFNNAVYRFYRTNGAPPTEADVPYATSATLPATPATTFGDAAWFISMDFFNGVIGSGFLAIGPNGETALRLDVSAALQINAPPNAPGDARLVQLAGGVVRVMGVYLQAGALRATEWAITYTTNSSTPGTPPAVTPTDTVTIPAGVLAVLEYNLPAQAHGTTVKARVQTRRLDGVTQRYSEGSTVLTTTADATGPSAPAQINRFPGRFPQ